MRKHGPYPILSALTSLLLLLVVVGCVTSSPVPEGAAIKLPWQVGLPRPKRWIVLHIGLPDTRRTAILDSWKEAGVTFEKASPGYLHPGAPVDLAVLLSGASPATLTPTQTDSWSREKWKALWADVLRRQPFDSALSLAPQNWRFPLEGLKETGQPFEYRDLPSPLFPRLFDLFSSESPLLFVSFDGRTLEANPHWERELFDALGEVEKRRSTSILILTYPVGRAHPKNSAKTPSPPIASVRSVHEGMVAQFFLKSPSLGERARLASALKKRNSYELIFTKQSTEERAHYITTYSKTRNDEATGRIGRTLEATFGSGGPDAVAIADVAALEEALHSPMWLWSPALATSPQKATTQPNWFDIALLLKNDLASPAPAAVRDGFSPFFPSP